MATGWFDRLAAGNIVQQGFARLCKLAARVASTFVLVQAGPGLIGSRDEQKVCRVGLGSTRSVRCRH
mgnify:CR=1 FL=1